MRALVEQRKIPVDTRDTDGSTLLLIAVNTNREPVVKFLLALGANPNVTDAKGWTPLISAADEGNAANVQMLLAAGADRGATMRGKTAEAQAEIKGHREVARMIREHAPAAAR
jgi:ankyrin repeat protein